MNQNSEWVVVGTYENETGWVSEVMAEGFANEEQATQERGRMARRCPEVAFEAKPAAWVEVERALGARI